MAEAVATPDGETTPPINDNSATRTHVVQTISTL